MYQASLVQFSDFELVNPILLGSSLAFRTSYSKMHVKLLRSCFLLLLKY